MSLRSLGGLAVFAFAASFGSAAFADAWEAPPEPRPAYRPVYKDREYRAPRHRVVRRAPRVYVERAPCSYGYQDHVSCGNAYFGPHMKAYAPAAAYYHQAPSYSVAASYGAASAYYHKPYRSYHYGYAGSVIASPFYNAPLYNRPCLC